MSAGLPLLLDPPWSVAFALRSSVPVGLALLLVAVLRPSAEVRRQLLGAAFVAALLLPLLGGLAPPMGSCEPCALPASQALPLAPPSSGIPAVGEASGTTVTPAAPLATWPMVWAIGAAFFFWRLYRSHRAVSRLCRRAEPAPKTLTDAVAALAGETGSAPPRLVLLAATTGPFTYGLLRPRIVLPNNAVTWDADTLRMVLAHELAHVRRRDLALRTVGQVVCALQWFHPLMWLARRRLDHACEVASDDVALRAAPTPAHYAQLLIDTVRRCRERTPELATTGVLGAGLEDRVRRILNARHVMTTPRHLWLVPFLVAFVTAGIGRPQDPAPAESRGDPIEKVVSVPEGTRALSFEVSAGRIRLTPGKELRVTLRVEPPEGAGPAGKDFADHVQVESDGGTLRLRDAHRDEKESWKIHLEATIPADLGLGAAIGAGDVVVEMPQRRVASFDATVGAGNVVAELGAVGSVSARVGAGNVLLSAEPQNARCAVDLLASAGNVELALPEGTKGSLRISSAVGDTRVDEGLRLEQRRRDGGEGPTFSLRTSVGNARVRVR